MIFRANTGRVNIFLIPTTGIDEDAVAEFFAEVEQMVVSFPRLPFISLVGAHLFKIQPNVRNVLASAFERLVSSLKVSAPGLSKPKDLRQVLIVLQVS